MNKKIHTLRSIVQSSSTVVVEIKAKIRKFCFTKFREYPYNGSRGVMFKQTDIHYVRLHT